MKRMLALALAVMMLGAAGCAAAEEEQGTPLYATVGEALDAARAVVGEEGGVVAGGMGGEYYAVVTEKDGTYYRSVAYYDEKLTALETARDELDYEAEDFFDKLNAAFEEIEAYARTLPIAYTEKFTAEPLAQAELDTLSGKTISELTEAGWEAMSYGGSGEGDVVYTMRNGLFNYDCVMEADFDTFEKAQEEGTDGELVVKSAKFAGITGSAWEKRFHTDGTAEEESGSFMFDLPPEFEAVMGAFQEFVEAAKRGEDIDINQLIDTVEEQFPEKKEQIEAGREMVEQMIEMYGVEGVMEMFQTGE